MCIINTRATHEKQQRHTHAHSHTPYFTTATTRTNTLALSFRTKPLLTPYTQIYDLETRYLEGCNPNANALMGELCVRGVVEWLRVVGWCVCMSLCFNQKELDIHNDYYSGYEGLRNTVAGVSKPGAVGGAGAGGGAGGNNASSYYYSGGGAGGGGGGGRGGASTQQQQQQGQQQHSGDGVVAEEDRIFSGSSTTNMPR